MADSKELNLLDLPPIMMREIAANIKSPITVVKKYGYTSDDYLIMSTNTLFQREIDRIAAELHSEGFTTKAKMLMLAEDLLVDAAEAAKKSDSVQNKLDVAKYLSKISGLEPQAGAVLGNGGGFSVVFNFSGQKPVTIEARAHNDEIVIDADGFPSAPPLHIQRLLPEDGNSDLSEGVENVSSPVHTGTQC